MKIIFIKKYNNKKQLYFDSIIDATIYLENISGSKRTTIRRKLFDCLNNTNKSYYGFRIYNAVEYDKKEHLKKKKVMFQKYLYINKNTTDLVNIDDITTYYNKYYQRDDPSRFNVMLFKKLILEYNKKIVEKTVLNDLTYNLPQGLGKLYISKQYAEKADIDFNASKRFNTKIHFDQMFKYRLKISINKKYTSNRYYIFQSASFFKEMFKKFLNKIEYSIK